jgi:hypothetical protein
MDAADSALRAAFSADRALMLWSSGIVTFGLVWQMGLLWWASRGGQSKRDTAGLIVASLLVLAGIACVATFGSQASDDAAGLIRASDERVAASNAAAEAERAKAAEALKQLAGLTRDAMIAVQRTAELENQAAQAKREADTARLEAERLRTALLPAEQQLTDSKLALERIHNQLNWREISPEGERRLAGVLAGGSGRVTILWIDNDAEALNLAIVLSQAFVLTNRQAGARQWILKGDPTFNSRALLRGLFVPGPDNDSVQSVRKAFDAAGLDYTTDDAPGVARPADADVMIVVGTKPLPF